MGTTAPDSEEGRADGCRRGPAALRHTRKTEEVCPANWEPGMPAMSPDVESVSKFLRDARS